MVYHDRPALTKMSIDDMLGAMHFFRDEGHDIQAIVIGDSYNVAAYCQRAGIRHEMFENSPIADKFSYAWLRAVQANCDYIAWWGSNNVHGAGYLAECNEVLHGNKVATFGTRNCVIMSASPEERETCVFTPRKNYLISSGQFFLTHSIKNSVNVLTVYDRDQTFNFDGKILDCMTSKWGDDIVQVVTHDEEDCIDVKNDVNIHSYRSYMDVKAYDRYLSRDEIRPRHPSLDLYLNGHFD
jgi:hypothetical protein